MGVGRNASRLSGVLSQCRFRPAHALLQVAKKVDCKKVLLPDKVGNQFSYVHDSQQRNSSGDPDHTDVVVGFDSGAKPVIFVE